MAWHDTAQSQKFRKRIEEVFGWLKTVGLFRKTRYRGVRKINLHFTLGYCLQLGPDAKFGGWYHLMRGKTAEKA